MERKKTKTIKEVTKGKVYVSATFNNTLVTITDEDGNTLGWSSSGAVGFKGARKSTPYAATTAVETLARRLAERGLKEVEVYIKGPGSGRDASIRALKNTGLAIKAIADVTPIPHNGPRPRKRRRA
ncbi:MAG TPA: 30S ribosomal protein S11 [Candidatus Saccharimonadales bacterium]|nr:30S ribosomal protein S11 [Candidatus Saccharimonadales bacterium]